MCELRFRQCRDEPGYFEAFQRSLNRRLPTHAARPSTHTLTAPCLHRGRHLGDYRCDSCGTSTRPVWACELHKRCAETQPSTGVVACATCPDYRPRLREPSGEPIETFERVYAINLDSRPDRWRRLAANIAELPEWPLPEVRRLSASHGDHCPDRPGWWNAGGGAWGCRTSHVRILDECVRDGVESVLILEDDALFPADFSDRLREFLAAVPDDWEQIYLGGQHQHEHRHQPQPVKPGVLRPYNVNRTHAWAFRGDAIRRSLAYFSDLADWQQYPTDHIDHRAGRLHESGGIKVYCPEQWIVGQAANQSDIDGRRHGDRHWYRAEPFRPEWVVEPREGAIRLGVYYPALPHGGATIWLRDLLAALATRPVIPAGITVREELPPARRVEMPDGWRVTRSLRTVTSNADVMLVWDASNLKSLRQHYSGPVIALSHGGCDWSRRMLRPIAPLASHWAAVSQHAADAFPEWCRPAVQIIPPIITDAPRAARDGARRELGIPDDRLAIGFVGRIAADKDPLAVARAVSVMPDAVAVYIGPDCSDGKGQKFGPQIRRLAGDRVIWQDGWIENPRRLLPALDCLVLTSPSEGCSLAASEAMHAGVPIVASPTGLFRERPELATLVPSGADGARLANAVGTAIRRQTVIAAREFVRTHQAPAVVANAWWEWLAEIAGVQSRPLSYAIVTVSRSGSSWLCELLASTGRLGRPDEYLNPPRISELGLDPETDFLARFSMDNGAFGVKVIPSQAAEAVRRFGTTKFVHLVRRDINAQAVSLYIAEQTGVCRLKGHDPRTIPAFNAAAIRDARSRLEFDRRAAEEFCRDRESLTVYYEDLQADPIGEVRRIAQFLGVELDGVPDEAIRSDLKILRSAEHAAWAAAL